jgi:hypothetical protein
VVTGIKLLNVGYAISNRGADDMMILRIDRPGPVVVAGRAEAFPAVDVERLWSSGDAEAMVAADPYLRRIWPSLETGARRAVFEVATLLRAMGLNPTQNTCETIMLARGPNVDLRTRPTVRVLSHRVWRDRVELRLAVTEDAIARLAYSHFPSQRVRVDGRDVAPMETAGGFLALRLQAGTHEIELQGGLSRLRRVLYGLDLLLLAAAVLLWRQASGAPRADVEPGRP